jgi:hypothetical protein
MLSTWRFVTEYIIIIQVSELFSVEKSFSLVIGTGWAEQCGNTIVCFGCWILKTNVGFWCQLLCFRWKKWLKSQNHLLLQVFIFLVFVIFVGVPVFSYVFQKSKPAYLFPDKMEDHMLGCLTPVRDPFQHLSFPSLL